MNISRIDGSRYGAVLFIHPLHATTSTTFSRAFGRRVNVRRRYSSNDSRPTTLHGRSPEQVWARKYRPNISSQKHFYAAVAPAVGRLPSPNFFTSNSPSTRSWKHTSAPRSEPSPRVKGHGPFNLRHRHLDLQADTQPEIQQRREDVIGLVDQYDDVSVEEHLNFYRDPYLRRYAAADGPELRVSNEEGDLELSAVDDNVRYNYYLDKNVQDLEAAILLRRRRPEEVSLDMIWDLYQQFPEPRIAHMPARLRHRLMGALGDVERKDYKSMLRYFSVVSDVKTSGYALSLIQWNTAMSFAARYVAKTSDTEVEAALQLWRELEQETAVTADEVTFNILYDAASKAGNFNLAEMIYREMGERGFAYNRYHHVSLIHFFGLKTDSSGVRAAYKEMVDDGEIIDTIVLNCVIASFIRCGEEDAAERVYEKMKASNKNLPVIPFRSYKMGKAITKALMMFARMGQQHPELRERLQEPVLLAPDLRTYRILINHYGLRLGDLSKVAQFLDEMKHFRIPVHGSIFLAMFKAFRVHGGSGSDWSEERLNSVFKAFLVAFDSGADGLYISTWLAMAILRAHARYANRERMVAVYDCLRSRWDLDERNADFMLDFLSKLLKNNGLHKASRRAMAVMG